jgi:hypothetical protein
MPRENATCQQLFYKREATYGPIVEQMGVVAIMWLVCFWLYRQRIFVRV